MNKIDLAMAHAIADGNDDYERELQEEMLDRQRERQESRRKE